jgi:hypothetical protein
MSWHLPLICAVRGVSYVSVVQPPLFGMPRAMHAPRGRKGGARHSLEDADLACSEGLGLNR